AFFALHADKRRKFENDGLDEPELLAKMIKKPSYQPTVDIPQDVYQTMWNSASAGNVPCIAGLEPSAQGRHLPAIRGKQSNWEVPREYGGPRLVEDLSAAVIAPWMGSEAHAEYRITRPFLTQAQNEALLQAWFQEPTDRLFHDLETMSPRQFFRWYENAVWDHVGQLALRKMLLRDVSVMTSYEGATFQYLEAHVKKYETYPGIRGPSERQAWSHDPWPRATLGGRRKSRDQEYIVEFQDSLVHCTWLKRADHISPEPDHRRDQGMPEIDFDPTPLYSAPLPYFNLRQRVLQGETARCVNIERK
ncbi:unnamed protein product, partial [Prorocentrum cordatum]